MNDFTAPQFTAAQGGPAFVAMKRRSGLRWAAAFVAALVALLAGLFTLSIIGYGTGLVPLLIGLTVAVLPVPLYVALVLWLDRYEPEPLWMLAIAFFWGALVAVFFAIIINSLGVLFIAEAFDEEVASFYGMVISAPLVEEGSKALALFILFFWKRDEFDGVLDGIVYAAMVGLGFAMTENVKYYGEAVVESNAVGVFIVRGLFSPYAHPLFTSMTGIGLGLARQSANRATKIIMPFAGFALAVLLHGAWNASAFFSGKFQSGAYVLLMYFVVMVPVFIAVLLSVVLALRREGRILREHLRCDFERGLLTEQEYGRLCTIRGRMGASFNALTRGGFRTWRDRKQFNRLASELAFHRNRVARGIRARDGSDPQREAVYVREIHQLRLRLDASQNRS
ncbi:MAG TPA: PrsW family intramembrane metalloprotease [Pyrinomonadaceae bacterium]|jgi:RsiW-degrading membrane proteinase PrsW (M82 family)|nr:PrsW family intramembrane metalloprotease [Pyrinomonadaceae bacterium]